jgi:CheY-like chemotaxis protein
MNEAVILIVDDDDDDRYLIAHAFEKAGDKVKLKLLSDGKEAIGYLLSASKEELPCLVVLDYNMPTMTGREVVEVIGKHDKLKHVPAIIFSTGNSPKLIEECIKSGAAAYKVKPSDFNSLVDAAKEMMELCNLA